MSCRPAEDGSGRLKAALKCHPRHCTVNGIPSTAKKGRIGWDRRDTHSGQPGTPSHQSTRLRPGSGRRARHRRPRRAVGNLTFPVPWTPGERDFRLSLAMLTTNNLPL